MLIRVPYVPHVKVQILSFNMIPISSPWRVPKPSYPFRGKFGRSGKSRSPKKLKGIICVPYVAYLKVKFLNFNVILISSQWRVPSPSYPFRGKFGRSGKGSFTEIAKIVNSCTLCSETKSTGSKLQYDSYLFSVACSQTEIFISVNTWNIRYRVLLQ